MTSDLADLNVPYRLLLGPGPSLVHPRVYRAMSQPVIGYLDPVFIQLLDDTQRPLRTVFRTENDFTMAISGTGTAVMVVACFNLALPRVNAVDWLHWVSLLKRLFVSGRFGGVVYVCCECWGDC